MVPPIDLSAFNALVAISAPRVSPNGREVAFLETKRDLASDKNETTLCLVSSAGGAVRVLTRPGTDLSDPRWSPSGSAIAYVDIGSNKRDQIFVVSSSGGTPHQITNAANGIEQYAWSPDGGRFVFVTPDDEPNAAAAKRGDDLFQIHDDGYRIDKPAVPSHLWLISSRDGSARRLTAGSRSVLETAPPFVGTLSDPSWSPDGRYITFTQQADADNSDSDRTKVAIVDLRTGSVRAATTHLKYEYQPVFCPTSDALAYIYPHGPGPLSRMDVFVAKPSSTATRDVDASFDRDVTEMAWLPGGRSSIVMADDGIGVGLWRISFSGVTKRLDLGGLNVEDFDVSRSGEIAAVLSNETMAPELYLVSQSGSAPHRLTWVNARFAQYAYGRAHELRWSTPDGMHDDGIVTYPVGCVPGRKYPLVVYLHGGPEASSSQIFGGGEIGRLRYGLSGRGYIVFEPNYRGSDNLGSAYEHAIYRDPGTGPGNDVMAGVTALENAGIVDTSRIAIVGHSYGGYMTTWLIGHEHIWRSATVADGMVDWRQEYDLSAAGNLAWTRDSLGGTPMDSSAAQLYVSGSPITYAPQITTPTLILSGTSDETVPITESFELYHALRDRGIPVTFIGLPGALHSPHKPVQVERYYATILKWVEAHF
jgi:dipeptidyl aminopeptidase/acylaminoacyl peptidase